MRQPSKSRAGTRNGSAVLDNYAVASIRAAFTRLPSVRRREFYGLAALTYGVSPRTIYNVCQNRTWVHVVGWLKSFDLHNPGHKVRKLLSRLYRKQMEELEVTGRNAIFVSRTRTGLKQKLMEWGFICLWAKRYRHISVEQPIEPDTSTSMLAESYLSWLGGRSQSFETFHQWMAEAA